MIRGAPVRNDAESRVVGNEDLLPKVVTYASLRETTQTSRLMARQTEKLAVRLLHFGERGQKEEWSNSKREHDESHVDQLTILVNH